MASAIHVAALDLWPELRSHRPDCRRLGIEAPILAIQNRGAGFHVTQPHCDRQPASTRRQPGVNRVNYVNDFNHVKHVNRVNLVLT